jgi:hypothetical protein
VSGKLDADGYIVCQALGEKHLGDKTEEDVDAVLRWAGYNWGPAALDALARYYAGWSVPEALDSLTREQLEELDLMLAVRGLVLTYVLPASKTRRVLLVEKLRQELQRLIAAWPATHRGGGTTVEAPAPAGGAAPSDLAASTLASDVGAWWSAWRAAVLAA